MSPSRWRAASFVKLLLAGLGEPSQSRCVEGLTFSRPKALKRLSPIDDQAKPATKHCGRQTQIFVNLEALIRLQLSNRSNSPRISSPIFSDAIFANHDRIHRLAGYFFGYATIVAAFFHRAMV